MQTRNRKASALERANAEVANGRLWRAKEILSGYIGTVGYVPEAYAEFGRILARMHDSREAGKFLFLSGQATSDEQELIHLYMTSVSGRACGSILSEFPSAARHETLGQYPDSVRDGLISLGFPKDFRRDRSINLPTTKVGRLSQACAIVIGITCLVLLVVGLVHGTAVVGRWLFGE